MYWGEVQVPGERLWGGSDPGMPGFGGATSGDLYPAVEIRHYPIYSVEGVDLRLDLPDTPWEADLVASIEAPTPAGVVDIMIPANSSQGRTLRLKNPGLTGKQSGDLYVVLRVALPPTVSDAAKARVDK